jgi:hypothetical protein
MAPPDPALVLKGFADLASWWAQTVAARWTNSATKIDAGSYTANDAASDLAFGIAVSTLGLLGAANEAMESAGVLVQNPGPTVTSTKAKATAAAPVDRPLKVAGPFNALVGGGAIALSDLSAWPAMVPANTVDFEVYANTTGHYASSYLGWVQVGTGAQGAQTEMVAVTLIVK